jgi:hypothetical protein
MILPESSPKSYQNQKLLLSYSFVQVKAKQNYTFVMLEKKAHFC